MTRWRHALVVVVPLALGAGLLAIAVLQADWLPVGRLIGNLGAILLIAFVPGAVWHLLRTAAWRLCFPADMRPAFGRAFRVRLAAEAFSYVTIRGVAGEPLKVVLLDREVAREVSASAVALERVAYILVTAAIVGIAAAAAIVAIPLSRAWVRVFAVVAAGATALVVVPVVLVARRSSPQRPRSFVERQSAQGAVARFVREIDRQLREMAGGDRRRLTTLLALELLAYMAMAFEVWVVLRLTETPVTLTGAVVVETFTRTASMLSAFIPGNLGALEASNVAAATAIHAAGGAAALAVIRRLRGLAWCACGFLIYPRSTRVRERDEAPGAERKMNSSSDTEPDEDGDRVLVVMEDASGQASAGRRLGGMPIAERIVRAAARAGYTRVWVWPGCRWLDWAPSKRVASALGVDLRAGGESRWRHDVAARLDRRSAVTVLAPGIVPSPQLLEAARALMPTDERPVVEVRAGADWTRSGVLRVRPACLRSLEEAGSLRALSSGGPDAFLVLRVSGVDEVAAAERRLRQSIFKPTDGRLGRFNRRMSLPLSVALIRWTRLSPHAMTVFLIGLGFYAGWLFSRGSYVTGLLAALVSWAASVLDGCDGELARLQYKDSAFGCWLDTVGDYTYYLSIFTGLTIGAARQTGSTAFLWIGGFLLAGALLTFGILLLLRNRITNGDPNRLRTTAKAHFYGTGKQWAHIAARLSTCATRASMPYGMVVFAVLGILPAALVLAAFGAQVYWISLTVELRRLLNADRSQLPHVARTGVV